MIRRSKCGSERMTSASAWRALKVLDDVKRSPRGHRHAVDATQDNVSSSGSAQASSPPRKGRSGERRRRKLKRNAAPREGERIEPAGRQREEAQESRRSIMVPAKEWENQDRRSLARRARLGNRPGAADAATRVGEKEFCLEDKDAC